MEEHRSRLDNRLAILRRRQWQAIVSTSILFALAVLIALLIPPTYRSSATIRIEHLEIAPDLGRTKVMSQAGQRLQVIGQQVMSSRHLSALIERHDLYPDLRRQSLDRAVAEMRKRIALDMTRVDVLEARTGGTPEVSIACSLSFEDASAGIAQTVVNELVSLFLNTAPNSRPLQNETTTSLHKAAETLAVEINTLKTKLAALEQHPDNEHEMRTLTRDYEHAMARYRDIREQSLQAELVQSLAPAHPRGERFSLIEPPQESERSDMPDRLAILVIGLVIAGAGGIGRLARTKRLDKGLHGPRVIQLAIPIPLLVVVPYIETTRARQARLKRIYTFASIVLTFVLAATAVFHWLVMPLSVIWSVLMRRIDITTPGLLS